MGKSNKRRRYSDGTAFKQAGTVVGGGGGSGKKGPMSREINRLLRKFSNGKSLIDINDFMTFLVYEKPEFGRLGDVFKKETPEAVEDHNGSISFATSDAESVSFSQDVSDLSHSVFSVDEDEEEKEVAAKDPSAQIENYGSVMKNGIRDMYLSQTPKANKKPQDSKGKEEEKDKEEGVDQSVKKRKRLSEAPKRRDRRGTSLASSSAAGALTVAETPTVRYSDVGGIDNLLQDIRELIEYPITHPEIYWHLGIDPPRGILLHGPPGCGKTLLANAIAGELGVPFIKVAATELVAGVAGESEAKIRQLFDEAQRCAPSILFLDEVDSITPKRENSREMERRMVAQLLTCLDELGMRKKRPSKEPKSAEGEEGSKGDENKPASDEANDNVEKNGGEIEEEGAEQQEVDGDWRTYGKPVLVIGATNRPDALDPALRRAGRFDRELAIGIPDEHARARILEALTKSMRIAGDFDFVALGRQTPGFVGADLQALTKEAAVLAVHRIFHDLFDASGPTNGDAPTTIDRESLETRNRISHILRSKDAFTKEELAPLSITMADFEKALKIVQPSSKREGFATIPNVTWEDVGALEEVREELKYAIVEPIRRPDLFKSLGIEGSAGVLLYGPPGCGKTMLAKAVANGSGANFISIKGPELLNKYVGESERAVRQVFARGRASAPCIVFFDELDALCPRRSSEGNAASERVVNQLLTEMDGIESRSQVYVIAATNRPDIIDPAILRPGRLDKLLYVALPTGGERHAILKAICRKTPLHPSINLKDIAHDPRTEGFSGADLSALVREASLNALRSRFKKATAAADDDVETTEETEILQVSLEDFYAAMRTVLPSVSKKDRRLYDSMKTKLRGARARLESQEMEKSSDVPVVENEAVGTGEEDNKTNVDDQEIARQEVETTVPLRVEKDGETTANVKNGLSTSDGGQLPKTRKDKVKKKKAT